MDQLVDVPRAQVLAHRLRATGLDRPGGAFGGHGELGPAGIPYLELGIQDTPPGASRLHWANRLGEPLDPAAFTRHRRAERLAMAWSMRGAPHAHRADDLPARAGALWPLSDADAEKRIGSGLVKQLRDTELAPSQAFRITADAIAEATHAAGGPLTKGELSGLVTRALPDELSAFCRVCDVVHVADGLFRGSALLGGVQIVPDSSPLSFEPVPGWRSSSPDPAATAELARTYLALLGPGTQGDAADFVGTTSAGLGAIWPDGLVEVLADGRRTWFPDDELDELLGAPAPDLVRLLSPGDPYLQGRDRELLVPDPDHRKALWKILGNPGAVVVDGEVVGTWRPKVSGSKLTITVEPLRRITKAARARLVEEEAPLVAAARGQERVAVHFTDA